MSGGSSREARHFRVFTPEEQARLGIDATGRKVGNGPTSCETMCGCEGEAKKDAEVVAFVGLGKGEYVNETRYEFVGQGAGEFTPAASPLARLQACFGANWRAAYLAAVFAGVLLVLVVLLLRAHIQAPTSTTTSAPFDCEANLARAATAWSAEKQSWCCARRQKGCAAQPAHAPAPAGPAFDCAAGFSNWELDWSHAKKHWCCDQTGRGCDVPSIVAVATTPEPTTTPPATTTTGPGSKVKLFCFLVAFSGSPGEFELVRAQYQDHAGIFQCNDARAYADQATEIAPGQPGSPHFVPHGMTKSQLSHGGYGWLENLATFGKVWDLVIQEGIFHRNDATVKVDPDTVFLPQRLRAMVLPLDGGQSWFIANCPKYQSMQGSIEVLSRAAVDMFAGARGGCQARYSGGGGASIWGDVPGEDMFLGRCLEDSGSRKVFNWDVVADQNCDWQEGAGCGSVRKPAYHKFKDPAAWRKCLEEASASG